VKSKVGSRKSKVPFGRLGGLAALFVLSSAAAEPYRYDEIRLGSSLQRLVTDLDLRDIHVAIARQQESQAAKPDLGRRGYGCARREDAFADAACVSHDERVGGAETREIRLHFLDGVLQQFSITAEIRHFEAVMGALRERYGAPHEMRPAPAGGYPSSSWRNPESSIVAYGGQDLVFVSFELAGYGEAVKRKQAGNGSPRLEGATGGAQECR
jgi:hypothetical protein